MSVIISAILRLLLPTLLGVGLVAGVKIAGHEVILGFALDRLGSILDYLGITPPPWPPIADFIATADIIVPMDVLFNLGIAIFAWKILYGAYRIVNGFWGK